MLPPGIQYDPDKHPATSAPQGDQQSLEAEPGTLVRRLAVDGTPYCACCDLTIRPHIGPGRSKATCTECGVVRRDRSVEDYNNRKKAQALAEAEGQQPYVGLTKDDVEELVNLINEVTKAVGRSSSHFRSQHRGTWQHALLLASKDLVAWREQYIPYETGDDQ